MFNKKTKKGFTLVEMLVAVAIFMMVVTVAMSALMSVINANRKARAIQGVVSNVNFVVESISRDMRMGSDYSNFDGRDPLSSISYSSPSGYYIYYKFVAPKDGAHGYLSRCSSEHSSSCNSNINSDNYSQVTSPDVDVLSMVFYIVKGEGIQPKVIIITEGESGSLADTKSKFSLQTTASQRSMKQ